MSSSSDTSESFLEWLTEILLDDTASEHASALGFVPFALPKTGFHHYTPEERIKAALAFAPSNGTFTYDTLIALNGTSMRQSFTFYHPPNEEVKEQPDEVRYAYSFAAGGAHSVDTVYTRLDHQLAGWIHLAINAFNTDKDQKGDASKERKNVEKSEKSNAFSCLLIDWAVVALDVYLKANPEAGNAPESADKTAAPLVLSNTRSFSRPLSALSQLVEALGEHLARVAGVKWENKDPALLTQWYHITHAAGVCSSILARYPDW